MKFQDLKQNRFLGKDPNQQDQTQSSVYSALNPVQKRGDIERRKRGQVADNNEDGGAPNIITGTVITSCIIQTTALPSRIEIAGNDVTFYDDTYEVNGEIIGDTSRLVFTHDLNSNEGFIMEKRASIHNTYDNVLSWYATPAREGAVNYLFIGRDGRDSETDSRNVSYMEFSASAFSDLPYDPLPGRGAYNGNVGMKMYIDNVISNANITLIYAGTAISGKTGVVAQVVAAGDGTASDAAAVYISYYNETTDTFPYEIVVSKAGIQMFGLPTSSAGLASKTIWNDGGTLKIIP